MLQVHPSLSVLLFRVPSFQHPPRSFDVDAPAEVSPLIAARLATSTHTRTATSSLRSVLRLSQPLDGLLRHPAPRAYSIPQPRPGFNSVQGLLSSQSRASLVERPFPHVVAVVALTVRRPLPRSDASTSRLSSMRRSVSQGWCLAVPSVAPLFGFHPPPGSPRSSFAPVTRHLSLLEFIASHFHLSPAVTAEAGSRARDD